VTDRRTDRQTDGQYYDSEDRASIAASRGKKPSHFKCVHFKWEAFSDGAD